MIIALCGFMGAGKTTAGKKLAAKLNTEFIDLDKYIEAASGESIAGLFARYNECGFRQIETEKLREALNKDNAVISLGGGALECDDNVELLISNHAVIVYLDVPFSVCYERIKNSERPLVKSNTREELKIKYDFRRKRFVEISDVRVSERSLSKMVESIIKQIESLNKRPI